LVGEGGARCAPAGFRNSIGLAVARGQGIAARTAVGNELALEGLGGLGGKAAKEQQQDGKQALQEGLRCGV
jgi:hypothetical protein